MATIPATLTIRDRDSLGPRERPSALSSWFRDLRESPRSIVSSFRSHPLARRTEDKLLSGATGLGTGLLLGAANAGLKGGLDVKKIPIDGVAGAVALFASGVHRSLSPLHDVGVGAVSIYAFRKTDELVRRKRSLAQGVTPGAAKLAAHGEEHEDRILRMAHRFE